MFATAAALAQAARPKGLSSFSLGPGFSLTPSERTMIFYGGTEQPEHNPSGVRQHRLNVSLPLFRGEDDTLALGVGGGLLHFDRPVILQDSGTPVPSDFYRSELALHYGHKRQGDRHLGFRLAAGYANDKPFNGSRDVSLTFTGTYAFPGTEASYWVLSLFASNNSTFLPNYVPIPGFLYLYRSDRFTGMFGLPVSSFQWRPVDPWTWSFSLFGSNISTDLSYGSVAAFQYYAGSSWTHESHMRAERTEVRDRVYLSEARAYVGVRSPFVIPFGGNLQIGQAFERKLTEGTSAFRPERGRASLGASWYVSWNLRAMF